MAYKGFTIVKSISPAKRNAIVLKFTAILYPLAFDLAACITEFNPSSMPLFIGLSKGLKPCTFSAAL